MAMGDPGRRVLGLDVGLRRVGVAISDPLGLTAQGLDTLERTNLRQDLARLSALAKQHGVELIIVGHPLHLSGKQGRQAELIQQFASKLAERSGLPVQLWDERLTTLVANQVLRESGLSRQKRARAVDRLSAVLILQSYLDSQSSGGLRGPQRWLDGC
ncbi:MAG: Holliday junction resolvase RuvX [Bryobacteraceae bacterium]|nr:Holliday junction resolvase RuvX [Bryobacteraceae bacterium]MDW8379332.1 Holliday junction resolvase RuvX [Bryobacterales bacterium]